MSDDLEGLPIGYISKRTGLAVSAIRFYEERGLVQALRSDGGQRRFRRSDIRRLSFVLAAQRFGFTIEEIKAELVKLPNERTPTKADWTKISRGFRRKLDARIEELTLLRDRLDGCIGCGCLSLKTCKLYNEDDHVAQQGAGPRLILSDKSTS